MSADNPQKVQIMKRIYLRFHNLYVSKLTALEDKKKKYELFILDPEERGLETRTIGDMINIKVPLKLKHATACNLNDEVSDYVEIGMCDPSDRNSIRRAITRLEID
jgi:hypothetical protein